MIRILVVEDDASIRKSLVDCFTGKGALVTGVATVADAERAREEYTFAVVLLDLRLPDGDGLAWLRSVRRAGDRTPVLITTARGEEEQRIAGLEAGADDYLVKPYSLRELDARIAAIQRRVVAPATVLRVGEADVNLAGHEIVLRGVRHRLVAKEAELLGHFVLHPGRTFTRAELLRAVWGHDALPTTRTVDTHVFQLRKKLEPDPERPVHLLTVHGVGYRWEDGV